MSGRGAGPAPLSRLWRFGVAGAAATAVHVAVGLGLHTGLGLSPLWANGVAFAAAVVVNFAAQARLTFPEAPAGGDAFLRFVAAALAGFALSQAIVGAVTGPLGRPYWVALLAALAVVPALSFWAMRRWAFRGHASPPGSDR
ncbi:MAG TPA: GtrA family protein [Thermohalobaculum sp.]|nr:GtrA family protein [Thermohalobaculum sp.]